MPTQNTVNKKMESFLEKIDKKIEALIEWNKKYPNVEIGKYTTAKFLRQYVSTEAEYVRLREEYENMKENYNYLRDLKKQKRLPVDRSEKLRNGNVRGIFGETDIVCPDVSP